jgi:hypothetical protein
VNARELLKDPQVQPSVAWKALRASWGEGARFWEPETLRIELTRGGVTPTDALMAKLLGAQTVALTGAVYEDHHVLFTFALACDNVPATGDLDPQPTVEQLAWALSEIREITGLEWTDADGPDPDEIDAAVSCVLIDEGFAVAPHPLGFCKIVFDRLSHAHTLRKQVEQAWPMLDKLTIRNAEATLNKAPEGDLRVQLTRLYDLKRYLAERAHERANQQSALHAD